MAGFTDKPLNGRSEDIFDVEKYIKGLSSFILECDTPMTVAVQGDWGSGKTSFMMLIREELEDKVLPVWFNTWQFSQFNLGDRLPLLLVSRLTASLGLKGVQGRLHQKLPAHPWRRAVPCGLVGGQHGDRSGRGGRG